MHGVMSSPRRFSAGPDDTDEVIIRNCNLTRADADDADDDDDEAGWKADSICINV